MIGVIVPFSRPKFAQNVLENFGRQRVGNRFPTRLIVVENGEAIGTFTSHEGLIVLRSEPNRSHARNVGLEYVQTQGIPYWAIMEDDDWYGPEYLNEVWDSRYLGHVTGKGAFNLKAPDGQIWRMYEGFQNKLFSYTGDGVTQSTHILAATLAGWSHGLLPFRPEIEYTEECLWYLEMQLKGHTLWCRGTDNFTLNRYNDLEHKHAYSGDWRDALKEARAYVIDGL